jgi:hypothetical protein
VFGGIIHTALEMQIGMIVSFLGNLSDFVEIVSPFQIDRVMAPRSIVDVEIQGEEGHIELERAHLEPLTNTPEQTFGVRARPFVVSDVERVGHHYDPEFTIIASIKPRVSLLRSSGHPWLATTQRPPTSGNRPSPLGRRFR